MALIFQLEDGDENFSSDFSDSTQNNIVSNGGNAQFGIGNPVRHATIPTVGTLGYLAILRGYLKEKLR